MNNLDEIKQRVFYYSNTSGQKSIDMIEKLSKGEDFSLKEVDELIDALGKYQAFVIFLRRHAKT